LKQKFSNKSTPNGQLVGTKAVQRYEKLNDNLKL